MSSGSGGLLLQCLHCEALAKQWKLMNDVRTSLLEVDNIQYLQSIKEFSSAHDSEVV